MAIVNNPNDLRIDDKANLEANTTRRDYILDTELKHELITQAEYDAAIKTPVKPRITPTQTGCGQAGVGRLLLQLRRSTVEQNPAFGATPGQRFNNLQSAGWKIYTTLDLDLEKKAKATMSRVRAGEVAGRHEPRRRGRDRAGRHRQDPLDGAEQDLRRDGSKATKGAGYTATAVNYNVDHVVRRLDLRVPARIDVQALHAARLAQERPRRLRDRQRQRRAPCPPATSRRAANPAAAWSVGNDTAGEGGMQTVYSATARVRERRVRVDGGEARPLRHPATRRRPSTCTAATAPTSGRTRPRSSAPTRSRRSPWRPPTRASRTRARSARRSRSTKVVGTDGKQVNVPASQCKQGVPKNIAIAAGYTLHGVFGGTAGGDEAALSGAYGIGEDRHDGQRHEHVGGRRHDQDDHRGLGRQRQRRHEPPPGPRASRAAAARPRTPATASGRRSRRRTRSKYPGDTTWPTPDAQFLYGQQISVPNVAGLSMSDATSTLQKAGFTVKTGQPQASDVTAGLAAAHEPRRGHRGDAGLCHHAAPELRPGARGRRPPARRPGSRPNGVPNIVGLTRPTQALDCCHATGLSAAGAATTRARATAR